MLCIGYTSLGEQHRMFFTSMFYIGCTALDLPPTKHKYITAHAKCVFYKNLFDRYENDMRKTWSIISDTLNKKVKHSIPDIMSVDGEKCSDKARISEHFNSFFATIGIQNENNIRRHEGSTYNRKVLTETGSRSTDLSFNVQVLYQLSYLDLYSSAI